MDQIHHYDSPFGGITLASDGESLTGLWFDGQKYFADTLSENYHESNLRVFEITCRWLDTYFSGKQPDFTPKLRMSGSEFRIRVWQSLLRIPYGRTTTYGSIAQEIAFAKGIKSMSAQAVGSAVGHNPISIIIPCHRVVGSDGSLTGYAAGIKMKAALLRLEKGCLVNDAR